VELHHLKSNGKYNLENIVRHTYGNQSLERFRIIIPKMQKKPRKKVNKSE